MTGRLVNREIPISLTGDELRESSQRAEIEHVVRPFLSRFAGHLPGPLFELLVSSVVYQRLKDERTRRQIHGDSFPHAEPFGR